MTEYEYINDKEYAAQMDREVRADYPDHADEARTLINRILRRSHKKKLWLAFNGEGDMLFCGDVFTTHRLISSLLECRDKGQPVTELYIEGMIRACLGLGFPVIQGGKID